MVCSTKTAGAAASRGSVNRRVNRRRTLHSILAHYTYENECLCGDGGGRGGNGPIVPPERLQPTDAWRPERGGLLVAGWEAVDLSDDESALRLRSDFYHECGWHGPAPGVHGQGTDDVRLLPGGQQAHCLRIGPPGGRCVSHPAGSQQELRVGRCRRLGHLRRYRHWNERKPLSG